MLNEVNDYFDHAHKRDTALNTERLVAMKKLELARQNGDKQAENAALRDIQRLDRSSRINSKLDAIYLILALIFIGFFLWIISPIIGAFFEAFSS